MYLLTDYFVLFMNADMNSVYMCNLKNTMNVENNKLYVEMTLSNNCTVY